MTSNHISFCLYPDCDAVLTETAFYCKKHLKLHKGLQIKKSTIKNAGKGLFTVIERSKGEVIDKYAVESEHMKRQTLKEIDKQYGDDVAPYVLCLDDEHCYDAISTQSNLARYANGCDAPGSNLSCNAIFDDDGYLVTTKKIKAGEEILVRYGKDYWKYT